ncbi:hypothetical protein H2201_004433 [Coniosporium apollinis]|uniref:Yip1 domain-containing protein n=1 Tax=Coniosporium apollinis TaxID=61459 RepID=A0ABQ9NSM4_9PEZI|nr:hypothetical protein H2201_004433 [Coniosporium apollinis]
MSGPLNLGSLGNDGNDGKLDMPVELEKYAPTYNPADGHLVLNKNPPLNYYSMRTPEEGPSTMPTMTRPLPLLAMGANVAGATIIYVLYAVILLALTSGAGQIIELIATYPATTAIDLGDSLWDNIVMACAIVVAILAPMLIVILWFVLEGSWVSVRVFVECGVAIRGVGAGLAVAALLLRILWEIFSAIYF